VSEELGKRVKVIETSRGNKFTMKRPTLGDDIEINVTLLKLLRGLEVEDIPSYVAEPAIIVATLNTVVIEPEEIVFSDATDPEDYEEMVEIFKKYKEWIEFFRSSGGNTAQDNGTGKSEPQEDLVLDKGTLPSSSDRPEVLST